MDSHRQLIEHGQYELAAHRLVCGAVEAYLRPVERGERSPAIDSVADEVNDSEPPMGREDDGQAT